MGPEKLRGGSAGSLNGGRRFRHLPDPPPASTPYTGALGCWSAQWCGSESVSRINDQRVLIRWVGL